MSRALRGAQFGLHQLMSLVKVAMFKTMQVISDINPKAFGCFTSRIKGGQAYLIHATWGDVNLGGVL